MFNTVIIMILGNRLQVVVLWVMVLHSIAVGYQLDRTGLDWTVQDWSVCWPFYTCSSRPGKLYSSPPTTNIIIFFHFLLAARLPFPASYWLLDSTIPYTPCLYLCPFPSAIQFTLKMEAARSSEMLVSYHITTWHHNTEDHDLEK
jgi:hypothetical protein